MFTGIFNDKIAQTENIINGGIEEPEVCDFINSDIAIGRIKQAISDNKIILIHCDIDMDGIGSGYIVYKFFCLEGCANKVKMLINKQRQHGITEKFVNAINNIDNVGLVIIMDSSSNELELIQSINTDVLVIDHHNIDHQEYSGNTNGGKYTIVNNMVSTTTYQADKRMSAGLVAYELLRKYYKGTNNKLEEEEMFNWVAVTLFTDAVVLDNYRNQYYLQQSFDSDSIEKNLKQLLSDCKQMNLCKNSIQYYIAPRINSAIRAQQSLLALNCVVFNSVQITELNKYKERQVKYLQNIDDNIIITDNAILKNMTNSDIDKAYYGVIASHLGSKYHKNTVVYRVHNGICEGSFRGRYDNCKYIEHFKQNGEFAGGHDSAFGFKVKEQDIFNIMESIPEPTDVQQWYITAGDMPKGLIGKYHIPDKQAMDTFKKEKHLLKLAILNSRLSSQESIDIVIPNNELEYTINEFGVYNYEIGLLGLKAISFSPILTQYAILYVEYSNGINIYIKELKN